MAVFNKLLFLFLVVNLTHVHSASLLERSYEYVVNLGKNIGPNFMQLFDCMNEDDVWGCAKVKSGKLLDSWSEDLNKQRRSWQDEADAEMAQSGRALEDMPSKLGRDVEESLSSITELVQHGVARALARKKHHEGGIDTITVSTSDKKKEKKKKPAKIQLVQVPMMVEKKHQKGADLDVPNGPVQSWVIGTEPRGLLEDAWAIGEKALDSIAEHAIASEDAENGVASNKNSLDEQRGKKKKKKKAILKLLLLGAVLKAKIGTLLQILSFKLQVKFFLIALAGLAINLARFWLDLKKQHHQQPQKVIYYEHAQHQHHYDEHEEPGGWGPWSRSIAPEEQSDADVEIDVNNTPYRAYDRAATVVRPAYSRVVS